MSLQPKGDGRKSTFCYLTTEYFSLEPSGNMTNINLILLDTLDTTDKTNAPTKRKKPFNQ